MELAQDIAQSWDTTVGTENLDCVTEQLVK